MTDRRPVLLASGGEVVVGRKTASFVWGAVETIRSDGTRASSGKKTMSAYVCRESGAGGGRLGISFVRADAIIQAPTQDNSQASSNLEQVIDETRTRTDGDIYFEREITGAGLAGTIPGRDYEIGSVVDVVVWGKRVPAVVTAITMVTSQSETLGWKVHVGGQLIGDVKAIQQRNYELRLAAAEYVAKMNQNQARPSN